VGACNRDPLTPNKQDKEGNRRFYFPYELNQFYIDIWKVEPCTWLWNSMVRGLACCKAITYSML